jgi:3-methylcrotonyl-CoA carboxylase alpha subunit
MNTRLQVEHPVTEAVTGLDLVEWQLRVASGERLPLIQAQIEMSGHAIEARLCAEDPANGFLPSTGPIVRFEPAGGEGVRVDSGVEQGSAISPYYDSLIAKLVASGPDRDTAIARLAHALERTLVAGARTNAAFLHALLKHPAFAAGSMDTGLIGRELASLAAVTPNPEAIARGVTEMLWRQFHDLASQRRSLEATSPWNAHDGFELGGHRHQQLTVLVDGVPTKVEVEWGHTGPGVRLPEFEGISHACVMLTEEPRYEDGIHFADDANPLYVLHDMRQTELAWPTYEAGALDAAGDGGSIRAPIVGRVAKVFVKPGDAVAKGDRIAVVEAMKMEHVLHAARDGVVEKVAVREGEQVVQGALMAALAE